MPRAKATVIHLAVAVAVLSNVTFSQDQVVNEKYKKWLCFVDWPYSSDTVARDFSVRLSFRGTPVAGTRVVLVPGGILSSQTSEKRKNVTSETDSSGVAYFFSVPSGKYIMSVEGGLLFSKPEVKVVNSAVPADELHEEWPLETTPVRNLRGKLVTGKELDDESVPLSNTSVQLLDLRSGQVLASTFTDRDGSYVFSNVDAGLYALRVVPRRKEKKIFPFTSEVAIELDPKAKEQEIPEMKMLQSDCVGVQLFRKNKSGEWE